MDILTTYPAELQVTYITIIDNDIPRDSDHRENICGSNESYTKLI